MVAFADDKPASDPALQVTLDINADGKPDRASIVVDDATCRAASGVATSTF